MGERRIWQTVVVRKPGKHLFKTRINVGSDRIRGEERSRERERENLPGRDYYFTISSKKKEPRRVHKSEGLLNEINRPDDKHSPVRFTFYTFFKRSYIPPFLSLLSKPNDLSTFRLNLRERWRHHVFYR